MIKQPSDIAQPEYEPGCKMSVPYHTISFLGERKYPLFIPKSLARHSLLLYLLQAMAVMDFPTI